jgi:hypothetical protein
LRYNIRFEGNSFFIKDDLNESIFDVTAFSNVQKICAMLNREVNQMEQASDIEFEELEKSS